MKEMPPALSCVGTCFGRVFSFGFHPFSLIFFFLLCVGAVDQQRQQLSVFTVSVFFFKTSPANVCTRVSESFFSLIYIIKFNCFSSSAATDWSCHQDHGGHDTFPLLLLCVCMRARVCVCECVRTCLFLFSQSLTWRDDITLFLNKPFFSVTKDSSVSTATHQDVVFTPASTVCMFVCVYAHLNKSQPQCFESEFEVKNEKNIFFILKYLLIPTLLD